MPSLSLTINKQQLTVNKRKGFTLIELLVARHPKPWRRKSIHGFTLIELLVVIAIIGILASFAIASFTSAQEKGRDSRRKADLDAIKKALELYKTDTQGAKYYPGSTGDLTSGSVKYIKAVPTDPKTKTQAYLYVVAAGTPSCVATSNCTDYRLRAILENSNDPQITASQTTCPGGAAGNFTDAGGAGPDTWTGGAYLADTYVVCSP